MKKYSKIFYIVLIVTAFLMLFLLLWFFKKPNKIDNWRPELAVQSLAIFNKDIITIKNVRNFRYDQTETINIAGYYDQSYDLTKISKVWFVVVPFKEKDYAAHTFLSFEFLDGKYVSITIEARKKVGQPYSLVMGMLHSYPLMYIVADERDSVLLRANVRKDDVYMYPVKASPEQAKVLFVDMLKRMNEISENPVWYNTFFANCTSSIAYHVDKIWPNILPKVDWQVWVSGYAEKLAFQKGLLDTNLSIEKAREKYYITKKSQEIGDVPDYSKLIRQ